jgi:murein DD-endopeptidase MepM/ murein hydrolase activator NlpD
MTDLLGRARGFIGKTGKNGLHNLIRLEKTAEKQIRQKIKGSGKDPLFYLGAISAVLFCVAAWSSPVPTTYATSSLLAAECQFSSKPFATPGVTVAESPDLSLVQKNSLAAVSSPMVMTPQVFAALVEATDYQGNEKEVQEYIVEPNDNLSSIAKKFQISVDTIRWANNLSGSSVRVGDKLTILPVSGVIHYVKDRDTLSQIAKTYKSTVDKIVSFNELANENDIYAGEALIVPDGTISASSVVSSPNLVSLPSSYFTPPIFTPYRITQHLHWYNAVDLTRGFCGDMILAAASGTVLKVSYSKVGGNYVIIQHDNGVKTYYGHLQRVFVVPNQAVGRAEKIGLMGGAENDPLSGLSTGCHVHFEVIGAANPFNK